MEHLKAVQAKVTSARVRLTQERDAECTFQPQVLPRSLTPPRLSHSPHKLSDSYSSTLHLDDAMSRKSTLSTIDPETKKTCTTYVDGRKTELQLAVRCSDGFPGVIDDMEDIQAALREVGIDW